jgi:hypothetical protein
MGPFVRRGVSFSPDMEDLNMTARKSIDFPPARVIEKGHKRVEIQTRRRERKDGWSLKIVAGNGSLTYWDEVFASDKAALDEALKTIEEDGIASFYSLKSSPTLH